MSNKTTTVSVRPAQFPNLLALAYQPESDEDPTPWIVIPTDATSYAQIFQKWEFDDLESKPSMLVSEIANVNVAAISNDVQDPESVFGTFSGFSVEPQEGALLNIDNIEDDVYLIRSGDFALAYDLTNGLRWEAVDRTLVEQQWVFPELPDPLSEEPFEAPSGDFSTIDVSDIESDFNTQQCANSTDYGTGTAWSQRDTVITIDDGALTYCIAPTTLVAWLADQQETLQPLTNPYTGRVLSPQQAASLDEQLELDGLIEEYQSIYAFPELSQDVTSE